MFAIDLAQMFCNLSQMNLEQKTIFDEKIIEIDAMVAAGQTQEAIKIGRLYVAYVRTNQNAMEQCLTTLNTVKLGWLIRLTEGWRVEALARLKAEVVRARENFSVWQTTIEQHLNDIQIGSLQLH